MNASPRIQSVGPPPDRHAERVVDEMLVWMHGKQHDLLRNVLGKLDHRRLGGPHGQMKVANRLIAAGKDYVFNLDLKTGKRGKFRIAFSAWAIWDTLNNDTADTDRPPPPLCSVAVVLIDLQGNGHQCPKTDAMTPMLVTRHACIRLAQRVGVRTVPDLILALHAIWSPTLKLISGPRWLNPPKGVWLLPLVEGGPVAVLKPDLADERLIVTTILAADMVDADALGAAGAAL